MKWAAIWAIFFLCGMMFFLNVDLEKQVYWMPYYLWDKTKDVICCISFLLLFRRHRYLYLPLLIFLIVRAIWEPLSDILQININDRRAGNFFFVSLVFIGVIVYLKERKQWQR